MDAAYTRFQNIKHKEVKKQNEYGWLVFSIARR